MNVMYTGKVECHVQISNIYNEEGGGEEGDDVECLNSSISVVSNQMLCQ